MYLGYWHLSWVNVVISLLQHVMISLVIIFLINGLNVLFIKRQKNSEICSWVSCSINNPQFEFKILNVVSESRKSSQTTSSDWGLFWICIYLMINGLSKYFLIIFLEIDKRRIDLSMQLYTAHLIGPQALIIPTNLTWLCGSPKIILCVY